MAAALAQSRCAEACELMHDSRRNDSRAACGSAVGKCGPQREAARRNRGACNVGVTGSGTHRKGRLRARGEAAPSGGLGERGGMT